MGDSTKSEEKAKPVKFWEGVKAEFHKITWPNKDSLLKQSIAVVVISLLSGGLIAILDLIFQYGINFITSLQNVANLGIERENVWQKQIGMLFILIQVMRTK